MTKVDVHTRGTGRDDAADLDITVGHHYPVNEQFHHLAALGEGRLGQALLDLLTESLNGRHNLCDRLVLVHVCLQLLPLPFQGLETLIQYLPPVSIFRQRHCSCLIRITYPLNLASKMLYSLLYLGPPGLQFLG